MRTVNYPATYLSRWICIFVAGLLLLGPTKQVLAQEQKGAIAGTVTDQTGAALTGAQVTIEPQAANVVSNEQGLFIINALEPGEYKVTITYVGLAPFTKTVTVAAGQTTNVDAKLQVESAEPIGSSHRAARRAPKQKPSISSGAQTISCRF